MKKYLGWTKRNKRLPLAAFLACIIVGLSFTYVYQMFHNKSNSNKFLVPVDFFQFNSTLQEKVNGGVAQNNPYVGKYDTSDPSILDPFKTVYQFLSSTVYYDGRPIEGADVSSFIIFDYGYTKDKNHVYFFGKILENADPETFTFVETKVKYIFLIKDNKYIYSNGKILDSGINVAEAESVSWQMLKDKTHVYRLSDYGEASTTLVQGADAATFEYVGTCASVEKSGASYYKDKNHVYVEDKIIPYIDVQTFKFLGDFGNFEGEMPSSESYAKDKNHVYFGCGEIAEGVDPITFESLGNGYASDKNRFFYITYEMKNVDSGTFKIVDTVYAKDKNHVYYGAQQLDADVKTWELLTPYISVDTGSVYFSGRKSDIDRETFKLLSHGYVKDKNSVYHFGEKLENVDVETFEPLSDTYTKDKNSVYRHGFVIKGPDVETFTTVNEKYAKDKNNVYDDLSIIPGVNIATFVDIGYGYAKDKNRVYTRGGDVLTNVDVATFKAVSEYMFEDKDYVYTFDGKQPTKK